MPILHLIDANSTQACPAVMAVIAQRIAANDPNDQLLILGGNPLMKQAQAAGINNLHRFKFFFGNPRFNRDIKPWAQNQKPFAAIHCWSLGAMRLAVDLWPDEPIRLTVVHRLTDEHVINIKAAQKRKRDSSIQIYTLTRSMADRLAKADVSAEIDTSLTQTSISGSGIPLSEDEQKRDWHGNDPSHRVVALLSDHPSQVNAMDAAALVCLAGASLTDSLGQPLRIQLLMHPGQRNRQRAQYFLADQSDYHRVLQDVRTTEPWDILAGCHAALALGPDAEGLSLHHALHAGVPVITDGPSIAGDHAPPPHLHVARSNAHKDVAHLLHLALNKTDAAQVV